MVGFPKANEARSVLPAVTWDRYADLSVAMAPDLVYARV